MPEPRFELPPGEPQYLYVRLADHIEARVKSGDLLPGEQLVSESRMAARYQCAVGTIRQAREELRRRGIIVTLPAKGSFVSADALQILADRLQ